MADNAFENMVEQDVDTVLDTVVKDSFYWREWYNGTLFINGLSREIMDKVLDKLQYVGDYNGTTIRNLQAENDSRLQQPL